MMKIARLHSVFSEGAKVFCQLFIPADDHSRITGSPEVFRRIKAKKTNFAHGSSPDDSLAEWKFGSNRLRCVFNHIEPVTLRNLKKRVHLAAQTK